MGIGFPTGERPPRKPRGKSSGARHQPGIDAEADYERFLEERFGSQGPTPVDHPNKPTKKPESSETP